MLAIVTFFAFTIFVAVFSWWRTKQADIKSANGYFLAGRGLTGVVIAGSMILTNISAEQIIGLSGEVYRLDMCGVAWESTSAFSCIILASLFLPLYLRRGFTTVPQFFEERYDMGTRQIFSIMMLLVYVLVTTPVALYSGAVAFNQVFNLEEMFGLTHAQAIWALVWAVGIIGSIYSIFGGLKAVAVSDTVNGVGLLIGSILLPIFALSFIGNGNAWEGFRTVITSAPEKMNAIGGPQSSVPFGTIFTGMVAANLFYWCMNQFVIQRSLGAANMEEGQKGVLLSGFFKLLIPAFVCFPGVLAYQIFGNSLPNGDAAYPALMAAVLPKALAGFFCAILFGAVLSTYDSLLNSAATLFAFDIYKTRINKDASDEKLIRFAKTLGTVLAVFSMLVAPMIMYIPGGFWTVMKKAMGFINIPTVTIMMVGLFTKRVPAIAAKIVPLVHVILYSLLVFIYPVSLSYLYVMFLLFLGEVALMLVIGKLAPMKEDYVPNKVRPRVDMHPWKRTPAAMAVLMGGLAFTYVLLSPMGFACTYKEAGKLVGPNFMLGIGIVLVIMVVVFWISNIVTKRMEKAAQEEEAYWASQDQR